GDLFPLAFGALPRFGGPLRRRALDLSGGALGLHPLVADESTDILLDLAAEFLDGALAPLACAAHGWPPLGARRPSMRCAIPDACTCVPRTRGTPATASCADARSMQELLFARLAQRPPPGERGGHGVDERADPGAVALP